MKRFLASLATSFLALTAMAGIAHAQLAIERHCDVEARRRQRIVGRARVVEERAQARRRGADRVEPLAVAIDLRSRERGGRQVADELLRYDDRLQHPGRVHDQSAGDRCARAREIAVGRKN